MTSWILKYGLPAAGAVMLIFAVFHAARTSLEEPTASPPIPPLQPPFLHALAASGIVEARNGTTAVGTPLPGIVAEVLVEPGQKVPVGAPLFRLDDRSLQAELRTRLARLTTAKAQLARLEQIPLRDEVLTSAARVGEARASLAMQRARLERGQRLFQRGLSNAEDIEELQAAVTAARERLVQTEAADRLLRSGPAPAEKNVARAGVAEAESAVAQAKTELRRLTVYAPIQGDVLQVNVRAGEAVGTRAELPPVVLGPGPPFYLRVSIDEEQIARFQSDAPACAVPRGQNEPSLPLRFVRVEPLVVPRRTFTGDPRERIDARVLQVIYELNVESSSLHIGQRLEVFIAAEHPSQVSSGARR